MCFLFLVSVVVVVAAGYSMEFRILLKHTGGKKPNIRVFITDSINKGHNWAHCELITTITIYGPIMDITSEPVPDLTKSHLFTATLLV